MFGGYESKILKCKDCQKDVPVNASYPIKEVACQNCHQKKKTK